MTAAYLLATKTPIENIELNKPYRIVGRVYINGGIFVPIKIENELIFAQKLEYMHNNPLQEKWKLCKSPIEYKFSSAKFYETGTDELFILSNGII